MAMATMQLLLLHLHTVPLRLVVQHAAAVTAMGLTAIRLTVTVAQAGYSSSSYGGY